jgi:hypothetical protein
MRVLRLAEYLFGAGIRASVFEPLLADRDRELATRPSITLRVRWWFAIASALATCAPRATFGQLPSSLVLDLGKRAIAFFSLAYGLQWAALIVATSRGRSGVAPSIATAVPFLIIPVIWKIRVSPVPQHQQRLLAAACAAACTALSAAGAENWLVWLGYGAGIAWLTAWGFRLGDGTVAEQFPMIRKEWCRIVMVASALIVAAWPVRLALQISLLTPWWPRHQMLTTYILACMVALYAPDVPGESRRRVQ